MATLTFKVLLSPTSAYLNDLLQPAVPVGPVRSFDAPLLSAARTRTEFARRAFYQSQLHTPETHYRLTLDLVTLCRPTLLKTPRNTPVQTVMT